MALAGSHPRQQLAAADLSSVQQQSAVALSPCLEALAAVEQDLAPVFQLPPAVQALAVALLEAAVLEAEMLAPRSPVYLVLLVARVHRLDLPQRLAPAIEVFARLAELGAQAPPHLHQFGEFLRRYIAHEPYRQ